MKKQTLEQPKQEAPPTAAARRAFLGSLVAQGAGLVGLSVASLSLATSKQQSDQQSPQVLSLQEADFYASHTLLG